jgi:hypothetical protein
VFDCQVKFVCERFRRMNAGNILASRQQIRRLSWK